MIIDKSSCLELAAAWCNPDDGLDYMEYVSAIRRSITNGFIDSNCFKHSLRIALQDSNFSWRDLLISSKAVNPNDYPEILETQQSSKEFILQYFMPIFEELGGEL